MATIAVTTRALAQRVNRALRKEGKLLKGRRGRGAPKGRYYIVSIGRNVVVSPSVELEALGRKLGVLAAYEEVRDD
ncbi:MAG TPA: hypothetical protein VGR09_12255 [Gemmatimonadales bacterium]|nr:hypothetical protein [Gemmatimonadales bacterium]